MSLAFCIFISIMLGKNMLVQIQAKISLTVKKIKNKNSGSPIFLENRE